MSKKAANTAVRGVAVAVGAAVAAENLLRRMKIHVKPPRSRGEHVNAENGRAAAR